MTYLEELAAMARVGDNEAYRGTHEQLAALSDFLDLVDQHVAGKLSFEECEAFAHFCQKATSDEIIDEGLRLASLVS